jgi:hypothetical protein
MKLMANKQIADNLWHYFLYANIDIFRYNDGIVIFVRLSTIS